MRPRPSTEFTAAGLVNGDTVTSVTLTSAGAAATATVAGSPYAIIARPAVGTGLGNYTISYVDAPRLTVNRKALTITARQPDQDLRHRRSPSTRPRLRLHASAAWSTATPSPASARASAGRPRPPRSPAARTRSRRSAPSGTGLGNYTISYNNALPSA